MSRKDRRQRRLKALYRFQVIAPLLNPLLEPRERGRLMDEIVKAPPRSPEGLGPVSLSKRTLQRWLKTYLDAAGDRLQALEPKVRKDFGRSRKVPPELLAQVIALREQAPRLGVKEILKRIDHPDSNRIPRRTVSRALREAGYDQRDKRRRIAAERKGPQPRVDWDMERWEADFPNAIWQADSTPSIWLGGSPQRDTPVQLQLVNIIDDHSRLVVGGGFTERLRVQDFLRFLIPAIRRYGCPAILFVDRAQIHKSVILIDGLSRIGGRVIYGTKGHSPGRGKVERLHQTLENSLIEDLRKLSPVQTAEEATLRHEAWREGYAREDHDETGEPPISRWQRIEGNARIPAEEELRWAFRGCDERQISELGEIRWGGRRYKVPPSHHKNKRYTVTIRFDLLDEDRIWVEDLDGSRHVCPRSKARPHTERRRRHGKPDKGSGLAFRDVFDAGSAEIPTDDGPDDNHD